MPLYFGLADIDQSHTYNPLFADVQLDWSFGSGLLSLNNKLKPPLSQVWILQFVLLWPLVLEGGSQKPTSPPHISTPLAQHNVQLDPTSIEPRLLITTKFPAIHQKFLVVAIRYYTPKASQDSGLRTQH